MCDFDFALAVIHPAHGFFVFLRVRVLTFATHDRELSHALPDLRAIAYVSSATRLLSVAELETLLVTARDLNLQSSVTGVLLYGSGIFMPFFEGP